MDVAKKKMEIPIPSAPPLPFVLKCQRNKFNLQPSVKGKRFLKELQFKLVGAIESNNDIEVIKLIKSGVDLNCIILIHKTPLIYAMEKYPNNPRIANILIEAGANLSCSEVVARRRFPIHVAVLCGSLPLVQKLLQYDESVIDHRDGSGMTPLHYASNYGHQEIVNELLKHRSSLEIHCGDVAKRHALHRAIEGKHFDIAEILFDKGASVNKGDRSLWTPIFQCVVFNEFTSVKYLLNRGADVNLSDIYGNTPLHVACNPLNRDNVRTVVSSSVDYYKRTHRIPPQELQELFLEEQGVSFKMVKILVNAGAKLNVRNNQGIKPIHYVRDAEVMKFLLACGSRLSMDTLTNLELSGEKDLVESIKNGRDFQEQTRLLCQCRNVIRASVSHTRDIHAALKQLPLPTKLLEYIDV